MTSNEFAAQAVLLHKAVKNAKSIRQAHYARWVEEHCPYQIGQEFVLKRWVDKGRKAKVTSRKVEASMLPKFRWVIGFKRYHPAKPNTPPVLEAWGDYFTEAVKND